MKTKNYLGKQDENRGIIAFVIIFVIFAIIALIFAGTKFLKSGNENKGISSIDQMHSELEKTACTVSKFEITEDKLVIEGSLTENVNQILLSKLDNVQLVFKNSEGDKYVFDLDYFISTEGIEFSTISDDSENENENVKYLLALDEVENGEYFVFLRTKTESQKAEEGYVYKYYTLKNETETSQLEYNNLKIVFSSSSKVDSFLTIAEK